MSYFRCLFLLLLLILPIQARAEARDYWERALTWPATPQRIVSLSPASTEMLYAIGADKQLVGVTHDCNYPVQVQNKPRLGRFGQIQLERILKQKPDLILVTADMGQALEPLRRLNVPVVAFKTPDVAAIEANLLQLGQMTGKASQARQVVQQMQQGRKALRRPESPPSVVYLVWDQPLMAASRSSFIGNVLQLSGATTPVQAAAPFVHYTQEALLKADPDVLVVPASLAAKLQLDRAPYERLKAVRNKAILAIDDDLISRPGPRVNQAIAQIANYLAQLK